MPRTKVNASDVAPSLVVVMVTVCSPLGMSQLQVTDQLPELSAVVVKTMGSGLISTQIESSGSVVPVSRWGDDR